MINANVVKLLLQPGKSNMVLAYLQRLDFIRAEALIKKWGAMYTLDLYHDFRTAQIQAGVPVRDIMSFTEWAATWWTLEQGGYDGIDRNAIRPDRFLGSF